MNEMNDEFLIFTRRENRLIASVEEHLERNGSALVNLIRQRRSDLLKMAEIIKHSPSMIRELGLKDEKRNIETLTRQLCNRVLDQVVHLPTRAVLGYGFTVSKMHLFGLIHKLTCKGSGPAELHDEAEAAYADILFSLMTEELYKSILSSSNEHCPWSRRVAEELIRLWEYRVSLGKKSFAPYIRELWLSRHRIVPTFGTLQGTVELLRLSLDLPGVWIDFLHSDELTPFLLPPLEEFLFDLSFEQISHLRDHMRSFGIAALDRQEAELILSDTASPLANPRTSNGDEEKPAAVALYHSFLTRRRNAANRRLRNDIGPHRSLEEHFFLYLLNKDDYLKDPELEHAPHSDTMDV